MIPKKHIPSILAYFFIGLSTLTAVAGILFNKNVIHLSNTQLISVTIWTSLPWSCKLLFGSIMDSIKIAGSQRKAYLLLASLLGILSSLGMVEVSTGHSYLFSQFGEYASLVVIGLAGVIATVVQRLLFDTIIVENVSDENEMIKLQLHSRNAMIAGGLLGAILSGPLVHYLSLPIVFLIGTISPLIVFFIALSSKYVEPVRKSSKKYVLIAILYVIAVILLGSLLTDVKSQIAVFVLSLGLFGTLLYTQLGHLEAKAKQSFIVVMTAVFLFRTSVDIGAATQWYYSDIWKFDEMFFGLLQTVGYTASVIAMVALAKLLINKNRIVSVLIWLTVGMLVLSLPDIMIFYGYTFGMNVRHMVLLDSAGANMLASLSMVPLGIVIAQAAPEHGKVTYFALTASLMNLCMLFGSLCGKYLNTIFIVNRGDYGNLGKLLISSLLLTTLLSIIGIGILKTGSKNK